jgi:hypothetical protein
MVDPLTEPPLNTDKQLKASEIPALSCPTTRQCRLHPQRVKRGYQTAVHLRDAQLPKIDAPTAWMSVDNFSKIDTAARRAARL